MRRSATVVVLMALVAGCSAEPDSDMVRSKVRNVANMIGFPAPELSDADRGCVAESLARSPGVDLEGSVPDFDTRVAVVEALVDCTPSRFERLLIDDFVESTGASDAQAACVVAHLLESPGRLVGFVAVPEGGDLGAVDPGTTAMVVECLSLEET